jgi:uncharacterized membrane protein
MKQLIAAERFFLIAHLVTMIFGLVGLVIVTPHFGTILTLAATIQPGLSTIIQQGFQWSMSGGGVVNILLGTAAVAIYAYRTLGLWNLLSFMVPAVFLTLGSELLGTSTGFPFGHYAYLSGLGYKIAGLVPFTLPLSWFYIGLSTYLLAWAGFNAWIPSKNQGTGWGVKIGSIVLGAYLLTSWDFVLDPAMSQTSAPFWEWNQTGAFFGIPYQNFAGWLGTGIIFMSVAAVFWKNNSEVFNRSELGLPVVMYISNFTFSAVLCIAAGIWMPVLIGTLLGVVPILVLWRITSATVSSAALQTQLVGEAVQTVHTP